MGYTSYDFYRQKYFGESVSETEFPKWNEKASDKLDFLTSGNIRKIGYAQLEEFAREQIQKAVCRLADEMQAIEKRTAEYDAGKVIKSHSAGSESISFEVGKNKLDAILTSQEKQNMYLLAATEEYLQNVSPNLFYRGYE